jgi:hypothetical protein
MQYIPLIAGGLAVLAGAFGLVYAFRRGDRPFQAVWVLSKAKGYPTLSVRVMKILFYLVMTGLVVLGLFLVGMGVSAW